MARMVFRSGLSGLLTWPSALVCLLVGIFLTSDTFLALVGMARSGEATGREAKPGFAILDVLARGRGMTRASAVGGSVTSITQALSAREKTQIQRQDNVEKTRRVERERRQGMNRTNKRVRHRACSEGAWLKHQTRRRKGIRKVRGESSQTLLSLRPGSHDILMRSRGERRNNRRGTGRADRQMPMVVALLNYGVLAFEHFHSVVQATNCAHAP